MSNRKKSPGGLYKTLHPYEQFQLKGTDYILLNDSPLPVRLHIFLKSRVEEMFNEGDKQDEQS